MTAGELYDLARQLTEANAQATLEKMKTLTLTGENAALFCDVFRCFCALSRHTKAAATQAVSFYQQRLRPLIKDSEQQQDTDILALELKAEHFMLNTQLSFAHLQDMRGLSSAQAKRAAVCFSRYRRCEEALGNAIIACKMDETAVNDVLGVFINAGRLDLVRSEHLNEEYRRLVENIRDKAYVERFLYDNEQTLADRQQYVHFARALLLSDVLNGDRDAIRRASSVLIDDAIYDLNKGVQVNVAWDLVRNVCDAGARARLY